MRLQEYEWELEDEFEAECEGECELEGEGELEDELEGEEFLGSVGRAVGGFARRQWSALNTPGTWQRNLALRAARAAVDRGLPWLGGRAGGAVGGRVGSALGGRVGGAAAGLLGPEAVPFGQAAGRWLGQRGGQWLGQRGGQWLGQQAAGWARQYIPQREYEAEFALNPIRRVYPDALMAHLGHTAARAASEAEAEAFAGALVPLAAQAVRIAAPSVMRVAPALIRGVAGATQTLVQAPGGRPLVQAVPSIVRNTVRSVAAQAARGQRVTPTAAVRTLARSTLQTLGSRQRTGQAIRTARALDRAYHRRAGGCTCR
jgi:hypothetical protein